MKLRVFTVLFTLALVPAVAAAVDVGVGVFGGGSFPIIQDNAGNGTQFGVRVPIGVAPLLALEGFYAQSALGDVDDTFGGVSYTRSGPDVTTYGANAILRFGLPFQFYPYAGIGSSTIKQSGSEDVTDTSLDFGVGLGFTVMPKLAIDLRAELNAVLTGDTSRKFGNLTAGVSYAIFKP